MNKVFGYFKAGCTVGAGILATVLVYAAARAVAEKVK
jgi:hypothetical protein